MNKLKGVVMSDEKLGGIINIIISVILLLIIICSSIITDEKIDQLQAKIDSYECVIADTTSDLDWRLVNRINKLQEWCKENNRITESGILSVLCGAVLFDDEENLSLFASSYADFALDIMRKIENDEFNENISGLKIKISVAVDTVYVDKPGLSVQG